MNAFSGGVETRPAARVETMATGEVAECHVEGCLLDSDLKIVFIGQQTGPHHRCLEHWATARSVLVDAGYSIDYAPEALDWIMRR